MLSRMYYRAFAEMLKETKPAYKPIADERALWEDIRHRMIRLFQGDNSRFDVSKFIEASGGND